MQCIYGYKSIGKECFKIFSRIIRILIVIGLVISHSIPVYAISRMIFANNFDLAADFVVKSPQTYLELDFPVGRNLKIQSAVVSISITPGAQLHDDSSFSLYYNDKVIQTKTAREFRRQKDWSVKLPLSEPIENKIQVRIKAAMHISNDYCRDYNSGNLSYTINAKDTKLLLNYEMMPTKTVSDFLGSLQQSVFVVVPNSAELPDIMPAVWAYGILKKNLPHLQIQLVKASELTGKPSAPRVWVGLRKKLPPYFNKTQQGIELADGNTMLISAATVAELETASQRLSTIPAFQTDFKSGSATISTSAALGGKKSGINFGSPIAQEGLFQVASDFVVYSGQFGVFPEKLGMHLDGAYTISKDANRPVRMDVFFNDVIVHSSVLDQTGRFAKDIQFPSGTELLTQNKIKVQFSFPEDPEQCKIVGKLQSAQIYPTSYLWGEGQKKISHMTWQNISPFFSQQGSIIFDEKLNGTSLHILANIVHLLNQQLPGNSYAYPRAQWLTETSFIPVDQYVIVLAQAVNLPSFITEQLPGVQLANPNSYNPSGSSAMPSEFKNNEKIVVGRVAEYRNNPLIVISTNQDGNLIGGLITYFQRPENAMKIKGNIISYNQAGKIEDINLVEEKKINSFLTLEGTNKSLSDYFYFFNAKNLLIAAVVLAAIFIFILIYYILRKRRRNRELYSDEDEEYESESGVRDDLHSEYYDDLDKDFAEATKPVALRKRGRPRKTTPPGIIQSKPVQVASKKQTTLPITVADAAPKRGRPRKSENMAEPTESVISAGQPEPVEFVEQKRKRGRPPKNQTANVRF